MKTWESGFIESDKATLRYFRSGGSTSSGSAGVRSLPPLVLVHGFTDSALYFSRLAEVLASDWDVVAYDARGHGESTRLAESGGEFSDDQRVRDLLRVIEALSLDRPALIGHSMGGATIALTAARHPEVVRGAVLEDPAWWEMDDAQLVVRRAARAQMLAGWRQWVSAIQAMSFEEAVAIRSTEEPTWNLVDVETSLYARRTFDVDLFEPFLPERSPWRNSVRSFEQPVLLLLGSRVDRGAIITVGLAEEAKALNPLLSWAQIQDAGHHLRYDQFEDFLGVVKPFLASLL